MKGFWIPAVLLGSILAFSLWNGRAIDGDVSRWRDQLAQADALAQAGDWSRASALLEDSYGDWSARQTYLHTVSSHKELDSAGSLYQRCMALSSARELPEFRAAVAELREQLLVLSEMEEVSIRNIL